MRQVAIRNSQGMATRFLPTRIINVRSLTEGRIVTFFSVLRPAPQGLYNEETLAIVEPHQTNRNGRIRRTMALRAVMTSPELWTATIALNPGLIPLIDVMTIVDDFLLLEDRIVRILPKLTPTQHFRKLEEEVPVGGILTVEPFVDASFKSSIVPLATNGVAGTITFNLADVGDLANLEFVTTVRYPVVRIDLLHPQPSHISNVADGTQAYLFHQNLATLMGLSLPPIP
jgi:hypothetical protein